MHLHLCAPCQKDSWRKCGRERSKSVKDTGSDGTNLENATGALRQALLSPIQANINLVMLLNIIGNKKHCSSIFWSPPVTNLGLLAGRNPRAVHPSPKARYSDG